MGGYATNTFIKSIYCIKFMERLKNHTGSIRTKLLIISLGLFTIGLAIIFVMVAQRINAMSTDNYLDNSQQQISIIENTISNFYTQLDENIDMMAVDPTVMQGNETITTYKNNTSVTKMLPSQHGGIEKDIYDVFNKYAQTHPSTKYLYLATKEGGYINWPEQEISANYDPTVRDWYKQAIDANGDIIRTAPYVDDTNNMIISNAKVVKNSSDKIVGVVGIDVEQSSISNILNKMKIGESGYFMLVHKTGVVMADGKHEENNFKNLSELNIDGLENILKEGNENFNSIVDNEQYLITSKVISNSDWVLVALMSEKELLQISKVVIHDLFIVAIVIILIIGTIMFLSICTITIPIKKSAQHLAEIGQTDFTKEINKKYTKKKDEVGIIFRGINDMKNALKSLIFTIKDQSSTIEQMIYDVKESVTSLNDNLETISATTEQLATSMEETSATTEQMTNISKNMQLSITTIANKSKAGADNAENINNRASEAKSNVIKSQQKAETILKDTNIKLEQAIEASKVVEQIDVLSKEIMKITDQTDLLALNASIEAARAGEAGKGFAVVANEIKNLAQLSKNTVLKIQDITKNVISSVENLSKSSNDLLSFVTNDVDSDYKMMLSVALSYSDDSQYVHNLVNEFNNSAIELSISMENIFESVNWVSRASEEGATGTTDISSKVCDISEVASTVMEKISVTKENVEKLIVEVNKFKI